MINQERVDNLVYKYWPGNYGIIYTVTNPDKGMLLIIGNVGTLTRNFFGEDEEECIQRAEEFANKYGKEEL